MRRIHHLLVLAGSIAVLGAAADAYGNDRGIRGTMIAPENCMAVTPQSLVFGDDGWGSVPYHEGRVACPLPLNAVDLGATTDDNDITKFRIHYYFESIYDSIKGALSKSKVTAGFRVTTIICQFTLTPAVAGAGTKIIACPHDVAGDGSFYKITVALAPRGTGNVLFYGIDFPS